MSFDGWPSTGPEVGVIASLARHGPGGLIVDAVKLLLRHRRTLFGVAALFIVPLEVLQAYLLRDTEVLPETEVEIAVVFIAFAIAYTLLVGPLLTTALIRGTAGRLVEQETGIEELSLIGARWIPSVLLVSLLYGLIVTVGALALIVPGIYVGVRFYVATSAVVIEGRRGLEAFRRSWRLTAGRFWLVFATILGSLFLVFAVLVPAAMIIEALAGAWLVEGILNGVMTALATAAIFAVEVTLYVHLRAHHDLEFDERALAADLRGTTTR